MAQRGTVVVRFLSDTDNFDRGANHIENRLGGMKAKIGNFAKGAAAGFAAGFAVDKIVGFGMSSVKAFAEAQQASLKLQDAFKRFPALADSNVKAFEKQAEALARKTRFDDDATKTGQALLAQFGLTGKEIEQLTPLMQDYAAKTGKDLPNAAEDLGKALLGQGRALKEIGIDFVDTGTTAGNLDQLMGGLRQQVGGFAEQEGQTAQGKLEILKNRFGEMQEAIGERLLPVLLTFGDWMLRTGIPALEDLGRWIRDEGIPALVDFYNGFIEFKDTAIGALGLVVDTFLASVEWIVRGAAAAFGWVPGLGDDLREAARDVEQFRDDVNGFLAGLEGGKISIDDWELDQALTKAGQLNRELQKTRLGGGDPRGFEGGGAGGGWGDDIFIPRAMGGPVQAARMYLVGERGPELFVPNQSGAIVPNHALTGGGVVIHQHIENGTPGEVSQALMWALGRL